MLTSPHLTPPKSKRPSSPCLLFRNRNTLFLENAVAWRSSCNDFKPSTAPRSTPLVDRADDANPAEEALRVRIPVGTAQAFAKRTREEVGAGRPIC